jgi:hypothetical protein
MNNLDALLEVAIGMVFVWLVLSVAAMQIQEWISSAFAWRAQFLEKGIRNMLGSDELVNEFYNHPLILSLSEPGKNPGQYRHPSYIPANKFSAVMMDILTNQGKDRSETASGTTSQAVMAANIQTVKQDNPGLEKIIDHLFPHLTDQTMTTDQMLALARLNAEAWFNDGMERVVGWYKRNTGVWSFFLALVLALALNVDSLQIANKLWAEPTLRQVVAAQASNTPNATSAGTTSPLQTPSYLNSLAVPVGWGTEPVTNYNSCGFFIGQNLPPGYISQNDSGQNQCNAFVNLPGLNDLSGWIYKLLGLLITAMAGAQGSPFWFDLLKKLVNIRGSGAMPAVAPAAAPTVPAATSTSVPAANTSEPVG